MSFQTSGLEAPYPPAVDRYELVDATNRMFELAIGILAVLWSWKAAGFWYDSYWDLPPALEPLRAITGVGFTLVVAAGLLFRIPHSSWRLIFGYWILGLVSMALAVMQRDMIASDAARFFGAAAAFVPGLFWLMRDPKRFWGFVRLSFAMGMTFILLNSVTLLHWYGLIDLPNRIVPRGITDSPEYLDPIYFGPFGLTEATANGSLAGVPRLQGWALEPIHWGYFVLGTVACGFLLLSRRQTQVTRIWLKTALAVIAVHVAFIGSATMILTIALIAGVWWAFWFMTRVRVAPRRRMAVTFIAAVIVPGILIPFALVQVPNIGMLLLGERVFSKGQNWADKISFLTLGSGLYTRFVPGGAAGVSASHNFVLSSYLAGGYVLLVPLLVFLYAVLKKGLAGRSMWEVGAVLTFVLMQLQTIPGAFFRPSGALYLFMAVIAARMAPSPTPDLVGPVGEPSPGTAVTHATNYGDLVG